MIYASATRTVHLRCTVCGKTQDLSAKNEAEACRNALIAGLHFPDEAFRVNESCSVECFQKYMGVNG